MQSSLTQVARSQRQNSQAVGIPLARLKLDTGSQWTKITAQYVNSQVEDQICCHWLHYVPSTIPRDKLCFGNQHQFIVVQCTNQNHYLPSYSYCKSPNQYSPTVVRVFSLIITVEPSRVKLTCQLCHTGLIVSGSQKELEDCLLFHRSHFLFKGSIL